MAKRDSRSLKDLAAAARDKGKIKQALKSYVELEQIEPADGEWSRRAADMYRRLGRNAEAIAALERAIEKYDQAGFTVKAVAACRLVLQIDPTHAEIRDRLTTLEAERTSGGKTHPGESSEVTSELEVSKLLSAEQPGFAPAPAPPEPAPPPAPAPEQQPGAGQTGQMMPGQTMPGQMMLRAQIPDGDKPRQPEPMAQVPPLQQPAQPSAPSRPDNAAVPTRPPGLPTSRPPGAMSPPTPGSNSPRAASRPAGVPQPTGVPQIVARPAGAPAAAQSRPRPTQPEPRLVPPARRPATPHPAAQPGTRPAPQPGTRPAPQAATGPAAPRPSVPVTPAPSRPPAPRPSVPVTPAPSRPPAPRPSVPVTPAPSRPPAPRPSVPVTPAPSRPPAPRPNSASPLPSTGKPAAGPGPVRRPPMLRPAVVPRAPVRRDPPQSVSAEQRDAGLDDMLLGHAGAGSSGDLDITDLVIGNTATASATAGARPTDTSDHATIEDLPILDEYQQENDDLGGEPTANVGLEPMDAGEDESDLSDSDLVLGDAGATTEISVPDLDLASRRPEASTGGPQRQTNNIPAARRDTSPESLHEAVHEAPLLSSLAPEVRQKLMAQAATVKLQPGQVLFREGDQGDVLYLIARGAVSVIVEGPPRVELSTLGQGDFFGEVALVAEQTRNATVLGHAERGAHLLAIERRVLADLVRSNPAVLHALHRGLRERLIDGLLTMSPLFAPFNEVERQELATRFHFREVRAGTLLLEQGVKATSFFVLLSGDFEVVVHQGEQHRIIGSLGSGDICGEDSLMANAPAEITVRSAAKAFVMEMPADVFREIIMTHPQILMVVSELSDARQRELDKSATNVSPGNVGLV